MRTQEKHPSCRGPSSTRKRQDMSIAKFCPVPLCILVGNFCAKIVCRIYTYLAAGFSCCYLLHPGLRQLDLPAPKTATTMVTPEARQHAIQATIYRSLQSLPRPSVPESQKSRKGLKHVSKHQHRSGNKPIQTKGRFESRFAKKTGYFCEFRVFSLEKPMQCNSRSWVFL